MAESAPILQNFTKVGAPMLRSIPPVITASIMLIDQPFDRGADGGHCGGAGGVTNVVRAMEVEDVGNSSRNAVGELAGHGVFGHFGKVLAYPVVEFAKYVAPHLFRQSGEMLGAFQFSRIFGEEIRRESR